MPLWSILSFSWKVMAGTTDTICHNDAFWDKRPYIVEDQMEHVHVLVIVESEYLCKLEGKQTNKKRSIILKSPLFGFFSGS